MTNIIQEQIPGFETPEILRDKTEPVSEKKTERIVEKEKEYQEPNGRKNLVIPELTFAPLK